MVRFPFNAFMDVLDMSSHTSLVRKRVATNVTKVANALVNLANVTCMGHRAPEGHAAKAALEGPFSHVLDWKMRMLPRN